MNDNDSRTHQMLVRSREFIAQNLNDFAAAGAARQLFTQLQADITNIEQLAADHGTGMGQARQGTRTRAEARDALEADLEAIYNAARTMGVELEFPRPVLNNDSALLQAADVFATNGLPLKAQFIAHELPSDFLDDLASDKAAFQSAIADQANAVGDHISAREDLDDAIAAGVNRVRRLTGVVKVKYANNPGKLAEWTAASHIERPPRHTPPPPAPTPTSPSAPTP